MAKKKIKKLSKEESDQALFDALPHFSQGSSFLGGTDPFETGSFNAGAAINNASFGLLGSMNPQNTFQATAPTIQQNDWQSGLNTAQGQQAQAFAGQTGLANQLQAQANGQGPSLAQQQLNQATNQNLATAAGQAASARGLNPAMAARQAGTNQANIQQQAAGQSAMTRLQEQRSAQQQLGNVLAQQGQEGQGMYGANVSGFGAQNQALVGGQLGAEAINERTAAANVAGQRGLIGGLLGGLGGSAQMAEGGEVPHYATGSDFINTDYNVAPPWSGEVQRGQSVGPMGEISPATPVQYPTYSAAPLPAQPTNIQTGAFGPRVPMTTLGPVPQRPQPAMVQDLRGMSPSTDVTDLGPRTPPFGSSPGASVQTFQTHRSEWPLTKTEATEPTEDWKDWSDQSEEPDAASAEAPAKKKDDGKNDHWLANLIMKGAMFAGLKSGIGAPQIPKAYADGGDTDSTGKSGLSEAKDAVALAGGASQDDSTKSSLAGLGTILSFLDVGGPVPGKAKHPGDNLANDTQLAALSPKEIVLPRSVTLAEDAPDEAARFVSALKARPGVKDPAQQYHQDIQSLDQRMAKLEHMLHQGGIQKMASGGSNEGACPYCQREMAAGAHPPFHPHCYCG